MIVRGYRSTYRRSKPVDDAVRFGFDWSRRLQGDVITSSTWDVPAGLTASGAAIHGAACSIEIAGGTDGARYTVGNTITTLAGATHTVEILLRVDGDAAATTPRNHSIPGAVLTIPAGDDDLIEMHIPSRPYSSGPVALVAAQSGSLFSNPDATGEIEFQLPPGFDGAFFAFGCVEQSMLLTPDAAESVGSRAAGESFGFDAPGRIVSLQWATTHWSAYYGLLVSEDPETPEPEYIEE